MPENRLFDFDNPVNTGRQGALDVLKAGALWLLILCHPIMILKTDWGTTSFYEWIFYYASSAVGAQTFMLCMGAAMVYSRAQQPSQLLRRGISLLALGYVLNVFRAFLPMLVSGGHPYFPGELELVESLFEVDILQFAGMTFLYFGLLKHGKFSDFSLLLTVLFLAALGGFLNHFFTMRASVGASLAGLFIFTNELGSFPFFSWIVYPVAGYFGGKLLLHCCDKSRFYLLMFLLGLALTSGFVAGCRQLGIGFEAIFADKAFYGQNPITAYGLLSVALLWPPVAYFSACRLNNPWMRDAVRRWSSHLTAIYFVSWILLGWLGAALEILGYRAHVPQSGWIYFLTSIVVFFLSDAIAAGYQTIKQYILFARAQN